jgi:hypothetical protein
MLISCDGGINQEGAHGMNIEFRKLALMAFASGAFALTATQAMSAVKMPKTAKLLNKAEIIALYANTTSDWDHPNTDKVKGTAIINADVTIGGGTWIAGNEKGNWESKITFKGDQYCWASRLKGEKKYNPRVCNLIYQDGKTAYEVDPKTKKILSINTIR